MIEAAGRGPGAVSLVSLATSPRRGYGLGLAPSHLPPWHDGAGEAAAGFVLLRLFFFFSFKTIEELSPVSRFQLLPLPRAARVGPAAKCRTRRGRNKSDRARQLLQARTGDRPALPLSPAEGPWPCMAGAGSYRRAVTPSSSCRRQMDTCRVSAGTRPPPPCLGDRNRAAVQAAEAPHLRLLGVARGLAASALRDVALHLGRAGGLCVERGAGAGLFQAIVLPTRCVKEGGLKCCQVLGASLQLGPQQHGIGAIAGFLGSTVQQRERLASWVLSYGQHPCGGGDAHGPYNPASIPGQRNTCGPRPRQWQCNSADGIGWSHH